MGFTQIWRCRWSSLTEGPWCFNLLNFCFLKTYFSFCNAWWLTRNKDYGTALNKSGQVTVLSILYEVWFYKISCIFIIKQRGHTFLRNLKNSLGLLTHLQFRTIIFPEINNKEIYVIITKAAKALLWKYYSGWWSESEFGPPCK